MCSGEADTFGRDKITNGWTCHWWLRGRGRGGLKETRLFSKKFVAPIRRVCTQPYFEWGGDGWGTGGGAGQALKHRPHSRPNVRINTLFQTRHRITHVVPWSNVIKSNHT